MIFEDLEVGDKFTIDDGNGDIIEKILPEFVTCCSMIANVVNLTSGEKYVFPRGGVLKVTKL